MRGSSRLGIVPACLLLSLTAAAASEDAGPGLLSLLESYRSIRPAAKGVAVENRSARVGHMELTFERGAVFLLEGARGETLGLFFDGQGRYVYSSEDPADRQVIEANVAHLTKARLCSNHKVSDIFERMIVFFAAPALETLWDPGRDGNDETATSLAPQSRAAFEKIWKRIGQTYLEYDHLAAETYLNGGGRQYVFAEIEGVRETVGYSFDLTREFEERLFLFRRVQGVDLRFREEVSEQPLSGLGLGRTAPFVLKDARIEVSTDNNRLATIRSDIALETTGAGLRAVLLLLMNNRDPNHFDWASTKNVLTIRKLTDESGADLPFSHRYHEVLIQLPAPPLPGQTVRLHFEAEGDVLSGLYGERHNNYFDLMGMAWYPISSERYGHGHSFSLKVRTRKPFLPVASGQTVSLKDGGTFYELETRSVRPASQAVVFGGKYVTQEDSANGKTIRAHAYASAMQVYLEKIRRVARAFLDFYETTLGSYPFGDLDIVEAPQYVMGEGYFLGFGIAPPGMVIITSEAYDPRRNDMTRMISGGINGRLAHEIAHQWFPHRAMPASRKDEWLSESLAEYMAALALGSVASEDRNIRGFPEMLLGWRFNARSCKDSGPIEAASGLSGPTAGRDRECLLYNRGPLVLHMLHAMAGQEGFFAILRRYLEKGDLGPVTTDDLRRASEEILKTDLRWFFEDWFAKGGIPVIRTRYEVGESGGRLALTGSVEQADGAGFRRILIPLLLEFSDGRREVRLVLQDQPIKGFSFELKERPKNVRVDPYQNNLALYD